MARRLTVSLPEPVLDALYAEGSRTCQSPGQVAARVLREALPTHVEQALRRDLGPVIRGRVIDVGSSLHATTPPAALTDGAASTLITPEQVASQDTGDDLDSEDVSGATP